MNELLLCCNNPILIKSLYGVLRDDGYSIELVDHPALAVQSALKRRYYAVILDSESIGLSAEEAAHIIKNFYPDMPIIIASDAKYSSDALTVERPVDIEEIKKLIRNVHN